MKIAVTTDMASAAMAAWMASNGNMQKVMPGLIQAALDAIVWPGGNATEAEAERAFHTYRDALCSYTASMRLALTEAFANRGLHTVVVSGVPAPFTSGMWKVHGLDALTFGSEAAAMRVAENHAKLTGSEVFVSRYVARFTTHQNVVRENL